MFNRISNIPFLNRYIRMQKTPPPRILECLDGVAVLTASDIYDFRPIVYGQQRIAACDTHGPNTPIYSTGRLEQAISEGYEVWVVMSRCELKPFDGWWAGLLPSERVLTLYDRSSDIIEPWLILLLTLLYELEPSAWPEDEELHALAYPDDVRNVLTRLGVEFEENFEGFRSKVR